MANSNLHAAKDAKKDEFYTQLEDINAEMVHYENQFKGKTVLMNCDDPTCSNFWRYFHIEFERLGLKKIIATHYEYGEVASYKMEYEGGNDEDFEVGAKTDLTQNGDFRSPECVELLKEADIVVTNPPFSLFREYIVLLMEYDKKFIIIGNVNALTYKEVFPLIKDNNKTDVPLLTKSGFAFSILTDSRPAGGRVCPPAMASFSPLTSRYPLRGQMSTNSFFAPRGPLQPGAVFGTIQTVFSGGIPP